MIFVTTTRAREDRIAVVRARADVLLHKLQKRAGVPSGGAARVEAIKALAEIKDPRCIEAFFLAIQNGDSPLVEYWADQGLERLGVGMSFFKPD